MNTLCGLLNINKPEGVTSRGVVDHVVHILRQVTGQKKVKAGHCGTLDPMATGVLVVCVGQATRLVSLIQEQAKTYSGSFLLGRVTDTDDVTGETLSESPVDPDSFDSNQLESLLPEFTGRIEQTPPRFSAVHVNGKRAYELARRGDEVKLEPRPVHVHRLVLQSFDCPTFELLIECGSGTYVRSIGRDIGERLGCGATMSSLVRTDIGPFSMTDSVPLDELTEQNLRDVLLPPAIGAQHLPGLVIDADDAARIRNGREISDQHDDTVSKLEPIETRVVVLTSDKQLVAICEPGRQAGMLKPSIVFNE